MQRKYESMDDFNRYYVEKINFIKNKGDNKHCQFQTTVFIPKGLLAPENIL